MNRLTGVIGLALWLVTLPWVQLAILYGLQETVPLWASVLVISTLGLMTLGLPLWICALCFRALARRARLFLPAALFGAAFFGWICLNALAQWDRASGLSDWVMLLAPFGMTVWLVVSIPVYWQRSLNGR